MTAQAVSPHYPDTLGSKGGRVNWLGGLARFEPQRRDTHHPGRQRCGGRKASRIAAPDSAERGENPVKEYGVPPPSDVLAHLGLGDEHPGSRLEVLSPGPKATRAAKRAWSSSCTTVFIVVDLQDVLIPRFSGSEPEPVLAWQLAAADRFWRSLSSLTR